MRRLAVGAAMSAMLLVGAASARADGLPIPGMADIGPSGLALPGGDRWVTLATSSGTIVQRLRGDGSGVVRYRALPDRLTIPAVAMDGSPAGLSPDGGTLVLIRPRSTFPQRTTRMAVLDARTLAVRRRLKLRGDFSFDAISPDGRTAIVTQYTNPRDPTHYDVRPLDTRSGRMGEPIVDPRNPDEKMHGYPYTRATSPDGRWAYTLYGGGEEAFVHAVDTTGATSACIDLHGFEGVDLSAMTLAVSRDGEHVTLRDAGRPRLVIDARTFEVGPATIRAASGPASSARAPAGAVADDGSSSRWVLGAVVAGLLFAGAVAASRLRRREPSPQTPSAP
jgi:hypothetical protein